MNAAAPWSVKGIDPKAREVAKELARRSGMTLGEWLNRIILEDDMPEDIASEDEFPARLARASFETPPPEMPTPISNAEPEEAATGEVGRIALALDRLTDRIEASETRTGLAISGVEHSVRHAMARIETAEREHLSVATRFDAAAERLDAEQARASERLRHMEAEGPRSAEALKAIEARLARAEAAPAELIEDVVARLGQRVADAEERTGAALESLRGSLAEMDQRLEAAGGSVRAEFDQRLEGLAEQLARKVEDARSEMAERLATAASTPDAVEARLDRMAADLAAAEQRSAQAIESMGREVLTMAETLNRRVRSAEQRSAEAIEQVGGEIARIAGAVENRLGRTDQLHAEALERLGEEIGKITERLTDRIIESERRAARAIDDVGEQVAKVTERMERRHERATSDLAERLRASEERTVRMLEDARARLDARLAEPLPLLTPAPSAEDEADAEAVARAVAAQVAAIVEAEEPDEVAEFEGAQTAEAAPAEDLADDIAASEPEIALAVPVGLETRDAALEVEDALEAEESLAAPAEREPDLMLPPGVFGAALFSRAEPIAQPALDPANPTFGAEDFEAADGFIPLAETAAERLEVELDFDAPARPLSGEGEAPQQLSTRQVIEQARATARAAAAARPPVIHAAERRPRPVRGGLFSAFKPSRPTSTWQTALMVAGGAAFLSVGAAGVVLMEGPGIPRQIPQFSLPQRAALALSPSQTLSPPEHAAASPAEGSGPAQAASAPTGAEAIAADYLATARAVEQKKPGALTHLKAIAEAGHAPAQLFLARLYETGQGGVTQNMTEARKWTALAADAGDPSAMHNLALYYFRGEGGPQDSAAAGRWFRQAAEHGVVDSQYNLGLLYSSGSGLPKDPAQAYKWFSIAANAGDSEARSAAADLEPKLPTAQLAAMSREAASFQPDGATPGAEPVAAGPSLAQAQKVLGRLGYYKGRADGANSHDLKLAVIAYQRDQGLAATGSLDPATVSRLSVFNR